MAATELILLVLNISHNILNF